MSHTIDEQIAAVTWKVAGAAYSEAPHAYILKKQYPEVVGWFEDKIKTEGQRQVFTWKGKSYKYTYYYHTDGYRYWEMWGHNDYVLNRCPADQSLNRDEAAPPPVQRTFEELG